MAEELRLDTLLVQRGLISGRDRAKELILSGLVLVNGKTAEKPAQKVREDASLSVLGNHAHFVSRGAHKLEKALDSWKIDLSERIILDVGASTGGFTQLALERGAKRVYAVDVGRDQLAPVLQRDNRVLDLQQTDIRSLLPEQLPEKPDFAVCDVSFISLRLVLPAIRRLLDGNGQAVILIKPQFEAGKDRVGRGGLVKDPKVHLAVLQDMMTVFPQSGFSVAAMTDSPIRGGDGNIEYLAWLRPGVCAKINLSELVKAAQERHRNQA